MFERNCGQAQFYYHIILSSVRLSCGAPDLVHEYSQQLHQGQLAKAAEAKMKYHQKIVDINQNTGRRLFWCFPPHAPPKQPVISCTVLTKCNKSTEPCCEVGQSRSRAVASTKANLTGAVVRWKWRREYCSLLLSWCNQFPTGHTETIPYL